MHDNLNHTVLMYTSTTAYGSLSDKGLLVVLLNQYNVCTKYYFRHFCYYYCY